jgi:hypothetical protein
MIFCPPSHRFKERSRRRQAMSMTFTDRPTRSNVWSFLLALALVDSSFGFLAPELICAQRTTTHKPASTSILFCQLLGMNCAVDSEFSVTWPEFCERGGATDIHSDGWGLAYYAGNNSQGLRQFHDVEAAATSALAQFVGRQSIRTRNLLAHIRYATSGSVDLANVHPFARE